MAVIYHISSLIFIPCSAIVLIMKAPPGMIGEQRAYVCMTQKWCAYSISRLNYLTEIFRMVEGIPTQLQSRKPLMRA